jgi:hypothetical protein
MKTETINIFGKDIKIFDYFYYSKKYQNQSQSLGLDIICKCLKKDGCWEPFQTEITREILTEKTEGVFLDLGCHIGYYSILASSLGIKTYSVDGNNKFLNLFRESIKINSLENIEIINSVISSDFDLELFISKHNINQIKLIKMDLEGSETNIIKLFEPLFLNKKINNLIIEISPKFNNDYPELCRYIFNHGFKIYDIGLSPQRKLLEETNHLNELNHLPIEDINNYISNLEFEQSNFLFRLK